MFEILIVESQLLRVIHILDNKFYNILLSNILMSHQFELTLYSTVRF